MGYVISVAPSSFRGATFRQDIGVDDLENCLPGLIKSFVVRRAVSIVPTNALNKLFLQWARRFRQEDHVDWMRSNSLSAGAGGRRFPNDAEFSKDSNVLPRSGRGYTRYVLLRLEEAFGHKEHVRIVEAMRRLSISCRRP